MAFKEKIGTLSKISSTQVQLTDSIVKIGGQFKRTGTLSLSTSTGLDTGVIAASTFYYVYTVISGGTVVLKASLSNQKPTGFNGYKKVGAFYTDGSSNVFKAYWYNEIVTKSYTANINSTGTINRSSNSAVILSCNNTSPYTIQLSTTEFTSAPTAAFTPSSGVFPFGTGATTSSVTCRFAARDDGGDLDVETGFHTLISKTGIDAVQPDWKDY